MKRPNINTLLDRPHLSADHSETTVLPDPKIPTRVRVTIDQLVPYTNNPRQTRNPLHDEIKESIRNRGLDHAPNITRKSPSDPYMIKDGGNTRLTILRELWEETGERRFYEIECMFHPWSNNLDMLIGHAVENELRGGMLFIERALHLKRIKDELEATDGGNTLGARELARRVTEKGWSIDHSSVSQLLYGATTLFPVIPNVLWSGVGRDGVKKLRKIIDTGRKFWEAVARDDEGDYDSVWQSAVSQLDSEEGFDFGQAESSIASAIAGRIGAPASAVSAQLQLIAEGIGHEIYRPSYEQPSSPTVTPSSSHKEAATGSAKSTKPEGKSSPPNQPSSPASKEPKSRPSQNDDVAPPKVVESQSSSFDPLTTPAVDDPVNFHYLADLENWELQELAGDVAVSYAKQYGLEDWVRAAASHPEFGGIDGWHTGFIVLPLKPRNQEFFLERHESLHHYAYLYSLSIALRSIEDTDFPATWCTTPNHVEQSELESELADFVTMRSHVSKFYLYGAALSRGQYDQATYSYMCQLEAITSLLLYRREQSTGRYL